MLSNSLLSQFQISSMKSIKKINMSILKSAFKKNQEFTNTCEMCKLEFADPERTKRHMIKAHSKPTREK